MLLDTVCLLTVFQLDTLSFFYIMNSCCNDVTIMMSLLQDAEEFGVHHIWLKMLHPVTGLKLQSHRYRLMRYPDTLTAMEITDWLVKSGHASSRSV